MNMFFREFLCLAAFGLVSIESDAVDDLYLFLELLSCSDVSPGTMNKTHFKCADESGCLEIGSVCDTISQCNDGSDENFGCCDLAAGESDGTSFGCGGNLCISVHSKCDGPFDCFDGSDETACSAEEIAANKNKECPLPTLTEWSPPWEPNCSYFCGESQIFRYTYSRTCKAYKWDEEKEQCVPIQDDIESQKWCFKDLSYVKIVPCIGNKPCTITEVSYKTGTDKKGYYAGTYSVFKFGFWTSADENDGYCNIGVIDNGKESQRQVGAVDVYHPNVRCNARMLLDGAEPGLLRVVIERGTDGWKFDEVNITVNNMVKLVYNGGKVWLVKEIKEDNIKTKEVAVKEVIMLVPNWGEKELE